MSNQVCACEPCNRARDNQKCPYVMGATDAFNDVDATLDDLRGHYDWPQWMKP